MEDRRGVRLDRDPVAGARGGRTTARSSAITSDALTRPGGRRPSRRRRSSRSRLAASTIRTASQSTRRWISSRVSRSARPVGFVTAGSYDVAQKPKVTTGASPPSEGGRARTARIVGGARDATTHPAVTLLRMTCNCIHAATGSSRGPEEGAPVHVPDGFIDAPVSVAAGVVAGGRHRGLPARRPPRARRPHRPDGRAGRRVHLRRPDAQLPGRRRHQRPPARRRARRDPGRAVHRRVVRGRGAARAGAAVRRRRPDRARRQHPHHVARHRAGRLGGLPRCSPAAAADQGRRSPARRSSPLWSRCPSRRWRSCCSTRSAAPPTCRSRRSPRRWSACTCSSASARPSSPRSPSAPCFAVRPDLVYGARDRLPQGRAAVARDPPAAAEAPPVPAEADA